MFSGVDIKEDWMNVKAGRKKSPDVADEFYKVIYPENILGLKSDGKLPNELNFAVEGDLTFEFQN